VREPDLNRLAEHFVECSCLRALPEAMSKQQLSQPMRDLQGIHIRVPEEELS
jgi:hypothetical protein